MWRGALTKAYKYRAMHASICFSLKNKFDSPQEDMYSVGASSNSNILAIRSHSRNGFTSSEKGPLMKNKVKNLTIQYLFKGGYNLVGWGGGGDLLG